ncbi:MAG: transcriptional repressor LexA [Syntrophales bacterium]|jgi:repressor LexA|nr:transcriptional repressor LexA [Syntrophales bacterium]
MKEKRTIESVQKIIAAFFRENRRMPSYTEMIALLEVRSKSVVHFWIEKLLASGLLVKDGKNHLSLVSSPFAIPVLGSIKAGFPSPEEEALCDIVSMDEYLVARPDASFLLQVSGDSMNGAGIIEGDLVIVEKGREPKNGDIVIAEVDGAWTMKYFRKHDKEVVLESANAGYPPIRPSQELKIGGIVTASIRKYHT